MANEERGEATITLEGVEYGLRPSFTAIQAIEQKTEQSIFALALRASALELSTAALGVVFGETMRAWGKANPESTEGKVAAAVKDERVAELIFDEGVKAASQIAGWLLRAALTGGATSVGELKAGWLTKNPRPKPAVE
jgi:hypothetical protein